MPGMDAPPIKPENGRGAVPAVAAALPVGTPPATPPRGPFRLKTFTALRHRGFRYLWLGNLFSAGAWDAQRVTMSWLVYDTTASPLLLALMHGARAGPMALTAPFAGALADRADRRKLILFTQLFLAFMSVVFVVELALGKLSIVHAFVLSVLVAMATSVNNTARLAIVPSLVPKEDLVNAAALSNASSNITRSIGPALGGFLIQTVGMIANFGVQAAYYVATFFSVLPIKLPPRPASKAKRPPFLRSVGEGFRYVWHDKTAGCLVLLGMVPTLCTLPVQTLAPIYAKEVFHRGAEGYGLLLTAQGVGALVGAFFLATIGDTNRKAFLVFGLLFLNLTMVLAFAWSTSLPLALGLLAMQGAGQTMNGSLSGALLQMRVPNEVLGRVMGLNALNAAMIPLGGVIAGLLAERYNAPIALTILVAVGYAFAIGAVAFMSSIRKL